MLAIHQTACSADSAILLDSNVFNIEQVPWLTMSAVDIIDFRSSQFLFLTKP